MSLSRHFLRNLILRKLLLNLLKCFKYSNTSFQVSFFGPIEGVVMAAKMRSAVLCRPRALKLMWHSAKKKQPQQNLTTYWSFGSGWRSPANTSALRAFALRRLYDGFLVWARILEKMPGRWSRWDSTTRSDFNFNSLD